MIVLVQRAKTMCSPPLSNLNWCKNSCHLKVHGCCVCNVSWNINAHYSLMNCNRGNQACLTIELHVQLTWQKTAFPIVLDEQFICFKCRYSLSCKILFQYHFQVITHGLPWPSRQSWNRDNNYSNTIIVFNLLKRSTRRIDLHKNPISFAPKTTHSLLYRYQRFLYFFNLS